ncbi:serine/threonine-protein kinase [Lentzea flaviverrucosa]|uniref:non-specific serine/threonine protein kinase n=1 Tax=Lentzea flaviverrucosa TaxID=200379 RepID=A0A1H9J4B2_9PSEU|nr:serine/threonine-protein kinase [Lentzea flaviverrucosa]RDI26394.1 serine/threonine protein kinase [Lentzea flaviverrucosa]SEQ81871.1 Serine/threonine protein kinase [Lentzea flaviverrucosa]
MSNTSLLADRYRLGEVLGTGGVAQVRRARDVLLARDVAVKLFRPGEDLSDARRIDNEICALAGLSHPGLVKVYDADPGGETPYVVLELIEGRTLRDRVVDGPMAVEDVRRVGAALADALAHVHARGFVHRDVKPSNVLLDDDEIPRLADFGLVSMVGETGLTKTGQVVGTAAYLAPEQVRGQEVTSAADVYALGLVLLECLTGHREYEGSEVEAAVARLHRPPAMPDGLPFDLVRLLSRMTALSVTRRPTARECAEALLSPVVDPPTLAVARPPRPRGLLAAAAAVVAISAIGMGINTWNSVTSTVSEPPATNAPVSNPGRTADFVPTPVVVQPTAPVVAPPPVQVVDRGTPAGPGNDDKGDSGKGKSGKGKDKKGGA